jgi:hypothetical protein
MMTRTELTMNIAAEPYSFFNVLAIIYYDTVKENNHTLGKE